MKWHIKSNYNKLEIITNNNIYLIFTKLPTFIQIIDNKIKTDGAFYMGNHENLNINEYDELEDGNRYGTYVLNKASNTIEYIKEFWKIPGSKSKNKPIMMDLRVNEIKSFDLS